jgi:hypothetical protein
MGTDISGWVEFKPEDAPNYWQPLIRIDDLVHRSYGMFASLFGVRNDSHGFRPIAPNRGEPPHCSWLYKQDRADAMRVVNETWVLWTELATIDWAEEGHATLSSTMGSYQGQIIEPHRERRGDYLVGGWAALFQMMEAAAAHFGPGRVRLCVWFDQ